MSLGSMGVQFKSFLLIVVLLSSPIMFSPSFANENNNQPSDPMPIPPHEPDPTIHNQGNESIEDLGVDPQPPVGPPVDSNGEFHDSEEDGIDEDIVKVYRLDPLENKEEKKRVMGSLVISGSANENHEFECIITYVISTANGVALMQFFFLVTVAPGTYDNIEKICYDGDAVSSTATVTIKVLKDETVQLIINDTEIGGFPEEYRPLINPEKPKEHKAQQQQHYDGPIYNLGPEFWNK